MRYILLALLMACSPIYYTATKRCPPTTMLVTDLVLVGAAMGLGGLHGLNGQPVRAGVEVSSGLALWATNNYIEAKCVR